MGTALAAIQAGMVEPGLTLDEFVRTLTLRTGFNTRVVILGTTLLGLAAGVVGSFALLRKRALMGDALAHATLPGIAIAFMVTVTLGRDRSLPVLLLGAAATGVLGVLAVQLIVRHTRLREDAAIGIVLSVFFGVGVVLMSVIQTWRSGTQAGLMTFIYGQTAAMSRADALLIGGIALAAVIGAVLLVKEFALVCFDDEYASVQGWPVSVIDLLMMSLVVVVTVVGLQIVGLLLVIAMLIIPAAAARFWTDRLWLMVGLAGVIGAMSGYAGSVASALLPRMPAGAVIVLVSGVLFAFSLLFAPARGVVASVVRMALLRLRVARDHLLRDLYEREEGHEELRRPRETPGRRLLARWLARRGLVTGEGAEPALTDRGRRLAARLTRNHRLWEQYLVTYADVAPSHVDFGADMVEHVLSAEMVERLEAALRRRDALPPRLPHHAEREAP